MNNIKYLYSRKNYERKLFTFISYNNINNNLINISSPNINKYKNNRIEGIVLTKGYGKKLLLYIEQYLKTKGIKCLILLPSDEKLINYYLKLQYKITAIKDNNTPYMYKEL
jgi:hypothetical protein